MPLPLWAIGTGAASLAGGLAYGLSQGKRNTVSNPNNLSNSSEPKKMNPNDFLNAFLAKMTEWGGYDKPQDFTSQLSRDNVYDPFAIKQEIKLQTPIINPWDPYSSRYDEGQIARQRFGEPAWINQVADTRSSDSYNNWLKNDPTFKLGGREYRWEETSQPISPQRIAQDIVDQRHKGDNQYVGSYASLINQKRKLTGKNYIPRLIR